MVLGSCGSKSRMFRTLTPAVSLKAEFAVWTIEGTERSNRGTIPFGKWCVGFLQGPQLGDYPKQCIDMFANQHTEWDMFLLLEKQPSSQHAKWSKQPLSCVLDDGVRGCGMLIDCLFGVHSWDLQRCHQTGPHIFHGPLPLTVPLVKLKTSVVRSSKNGSYRYYWPIARLYVSINIPGTTSMGPVPWFSNWVPPKQKPQK